MLIPLLIAGLAVGAAYKVTTSKKGIMTPQRRMIYNAALTKQPPLPSDQLRALATTFDDEGLPAYADVLRKRADIRDLPPEKKEARQAAIKRALSSNDSIAVRAMAGAFDSEGATFTAQKLRDYADGLDQAAFIASVTSPAPPPAPAATPYVPAVSDPVNTTQGGVQQSSPEAQDPHAPPKPEAVTGNVVEFSGDPTWTPEQFAKLTAGEVEASLGSQAAVAFSQGLDAFNAFVRTQQTNINLDNTSFRQASVDPDPTSTSLE